ncbi:oxygen-insensitive NADPH nitroreductase [Endozoicomonas sp.]|uniref:oxygen-insensitive NADPH nitroreductase n=1 Tax=Endozoicomonas sp. TaxID=1892382 RepID=UPI002883AD47|nr:oxygen-insensitive NADPH nitroreductase [Endozoicomonas sp.]
MTQTVIEQLQSHRSIRKFTEQPIEESLLRALIAAGQSAATSSNLQGVSVIRVRNPQTRRAMAELAGGQEYIEEAAEFLVFCADLNRSGWCCERSGKAMADGMTEHFIISTVDVALFAQNVVVSAESEGLGICYIGALRNDPQQVSELLALPENVYPVFGLCLGYPDQAPACKPRLALDAVLMEEHYQPVNEALMVQYDETMRAYYQERTGGELDRVWSQEVSALLGKKSRPHMRAFLESKGFKMR